MFNEELNYEISIYDDENDLIERFNVKTEAEKETIILNHYTLSKEAWFYEVRESKIVQTDKKGKY
ncbi:hypothetical protein [Cytobacillus gottheilii]|uniref:hypothetical protein n=1 Tax=Cytobacillus gottheilii TaxID=859144 RepID=UPI0009BA177C|nr:hypothetical protein [Cytobacillus gottheilii]